MSEIVEGTRAVEVAEKAGVSRSAVSRAFNPQSYVEPTKRKRILSIAKELGYHPNMAARAMVTNRSHLIAVVLPAVEHPWESQELDILIEELQALDFVTLIYKVPGAALPSDHLSHLRAYNPDSIIVYSDSLPLSSVKSVFRRTRPIFPVYTNGNKNPVSATAPDETGFDQLVIDQYPGIQQALRLLSGYGCKSIAWLCGEQSTRSGQNRQRAVLESAEQAEIKVVANIPGDFTYERARDEVRAYFRANEPVDALIAANDVSAFGAMDALRFDLNYSIPEDIKVIGFDNINQTNWKSYDLTTVGLDIHERVRAIVRLIQRRLENPKAPTLFEHIETRLIVRSTVA